MNQGFPLEPPTSYYQGGVDIGYRDFDLDRQSLGLAWNKEVQEFVRTSHQIQENQIVSSLYTVHQLGVIHSIPFLSEMAFHLIGNYSMVIYLLTFVFIEIFDDLLSNISVRPLFFFLFDVSIFIEK